MKTVKLIDGTKARIGLRLLNSLINLPAAKISELGYDAESIKAFAK